MTKEERKEENKKYYETHKEKRKEEKKEIRESEMTPWFIYFKVGGFQVQ